MKTRSNPCTPTVSVVLPTFDRLPLLRKAVASVIGQTFRDWELVVADDGSIDGTRDYLEAIDDPRVRPLWLEHHGDLTSARSAGVKQARGRWVAFLDSDDLWLPRKLELQLRRLTAQPVCRWCYTGYSVIDADGGLLPGRMERLHPAVSGHILEPLLKFEAGLSIVTLLVRRSLIDEIGGFDESIPIHSDYDFALRLAARSEVCGLPENLALVREHPGRTTARLPLANLHADQARVFRKAAAAAATRRLRRLCLRQCAEQLACQAAALSREAPHRAAFAALVHAARVAPCSKALWRAAAGCAVRAAGVVA